MKWTLLLIFTVLTLNCVGQDTQIPTNTQTNKAEYSEVVSLSGVDKAELYTRALNWVKDFYPNPNGTIKSQESPNSIAGKSRFTIKQTDKKGRTIGQSYVNYHFKFDFKEGKYKYTIHKIGWQQPSYFDVSKWEKTNSPGYQAETYPVYVKQTLEYFNALIKSFEQAISSLGAKESDDW